MKRISLCLFSCFLCGCVDVGQVSLHPQTTTGYFSAYRGEVESCLENEALRQQHQLQKDDPLPGGTDRFNLLNSQSEVVAWIEVAPFSKRRRSAYFPLRQHPGIAIPRGNRDALAWGDKL
ncbi:MAG: hypothetical protein E6556_17065 [Pantoea sp.]|nr:hypothetical protein [Pantoea sp.]